MRNPACGNKDVMGRIPDGKRLSGGRERAAGLCMIILQISTVQETGFGLRYETMHKMK